MTWIIIKFITVCLLIIGGILATTLWLPNIWREYTEYKKNNKIVKSAILNTDFGNIIKLIESQLASESARVSHSAKIKDNSTDTIQVVPILIEDFIGPHPIKIAVEIFNTENPIDLPKIDSMMGKYFSLGIPRVIIVSKGGFTKQAYKKANTLNFMHLVTFEEAKNTNWVKFVNKIKKVELQLFMLPQLKEAKVFLVEGEYLPEEGINVGNTSIQKPSGELLNADEWVKKVLWDDNVINAVQKQISESGRYTLNLKVPMQGFYLINSKGNKFALHSIELTSKVRMDHVSLPFERMSYEEAQLAIANIKKIGHEFTFIISEKKDADASLGIQIKKVKEKNK